MSVHEKPLISVVMAVYNTQDYLAEAIESILHQSFEHFEFIIVDDGSTDASRKILQSYAEGDSRILALQNEENKGISYTRRKLLALASTDFIAIQDSDDISLPKRLQHSYQFLKDHDDYAVVSGNNLLIDEAGRVFSRRNYSDAIEKWILKRSPISQPSALFRKHAYDAVGGYDRLLNYGEDYDLRLKLFAHGYSIKNLPENLIKHRIRKGQTKSKNLKETLRNTITIQKRAKEYGLIPSLSDRLVWLGHNCLRYMPNRFILALFKLLTYGKK